MHLMFAQIFLDPCNKREIAIAAGGVKPHEFSKYGFSLSVIGMSWLHSLTLGAALGRVQVKNQGYAACLTYGISIGNYFTLLTKLSYNCHNVCGNV